MIVLILTVASFAMGALSRLLDILAERAKSQLAKMLLTSWAANCMTVSIALLASGVFYLVLPR